MKVIIFLWYISLFTFLFLHTLRHIVILIHQNYPAYTLTVFVRMYPKPNTTTSVSIVELASSALATYCTYAALNLLETIRSKTWQPLCMIKSTANDLFLMFLFLMFSQLCQVLAMLRMNILAIIMVAESRSYLDYNLHYLLSIGVIKEITKEKILK